MGWLSYSNIAKKEKPNYWINSRWVWFIGSGSKDISIQVTSRPSFSWSISTEGCEGEVSIHFWLFLKFYITFTGIFPEWVYSKEYNQFSDKEASAEREKNDAQERGDDFSEEKPMGYSKEYFKIQNRNKKLKGRHRTKEKGWIRTSRRELSLRFHDYSMWWNIWKNDDEWSSDIPWYRYGHLDFLRLLRGRDKVEKEQEYTIFDKVEMPEGNYMCKVNYNKYTRNYSRWWPKKWSRFEFEFGYYDTDKNWISTPIIHWGKGENSWDCGMDGTYSISLGSGAETLEEAKKRIVESCLEDREKYGKVDFSKVSGIEDGYVRKNLIEQFK